MEIQGWGILTCKYGEVEYWNANMVMQVRNIVMGEGRRNMGRAEGNMDLGMGT
jgi:hypothetical protein